MKDQLATIIKKTCMAFNEKDVDSFLLCLDCSILWPRGLEGSYLRCYFELLEYITNLWEKYNAVIVPVHVELKDNKTCMVRLYQLIQNKNMNRIFEGIICQEFSFTDFLIQKVEIVKIFELEENDNMIY